jgi:4-carboxymuconolactone decarboxylase
MTRQELEELVVHFAVYLGWNLARRLDDLLVHVVKETGGESFRSASL